MIIVLDTNVIIAALRSKSSASYQLLSLMEQGKLDCLLSVPLLLEYEAVLKREENRQATQLSMESIDIVLDMLCALGTETPIFYLWRPKLSDPQDDMVLELAVNGQADAIVTFNVKDFGDAPGEFGIELLTPGQFLHSLRQEQ
ncbi:putative toxin-antitoxin system toxin component, PIN family [Leucothrix pacifica]|uniref:Putative toxin-antitoxin system toxin component, PIN family n=2 Tax=Leucothrix pacifica TaxID=1247513 RepID=A0A317CHY2_9GAMM|nr:putative toxin-antitoxin system toxin component, PIN family [Leucothrix pacifica]